MINDINEIISELYEIDEYPVLNAQMENWRKKKPLNGLRILDATPIFHILY